MTPLGMGDVKDLIPEEDLKLFGKIKDVVRQISNISFENFGLGDDTISCHVLVRSLEPFFEVKIVDGFFLNYYNHSWLVTPSGNVIDVYPVGILEGPILVEGIYNLAPALKMYKKVRDNYYKERFSKPEFKGAVEILTEEVKKIISEIFPDHLVKELT